MAVGRSPGGVGCRDRVVAVGRPLGGPGGRVRSAPVGAGERGSVDVGLGERVSFGVGSGERDSDAVGGDVLGVSGSGVQVGSGFSVGRDKSVEGEGSGRGMSPSCATKAHMPTPPRASTTAPPAIHGARRGGRR
ncbi:hypothetical protein ACIF8T_32095 [Streptomyces sp. NPDC085946]|uniref:hypothetical protein n=1 Tax=Streptomyces sp. NPDC085946 TaxID=3365744 RepID=UPI0037CDF56C